MAATTSTDTLAALYQRVSTKGQDYDRQNDANRAAAERNGWHAVEYEGEKLSASRFAGHKGREVFNGLVADIAAGKLGALVAWDASRADRELASWASLLNACRRTGTLIHLTSEHYTYDVRVARDWKALANAGVDSAMFSEIRSLDVRSGQAAWAAKGHPMSGPAYGLKRRHDPDKRRNRWIADDPHPETGPIVAEIIRRVGDGDAYQGIADDLNRREVASPGGGQWTRSAIREIAGREVYALRGVVSEAESLRARNRMTDTARKGERPSEARFRYSQVMRCDRCGGRIRGMGRSGRDVYLCNNKHAERTPYGQGWIDAAEVDAFIDAIAIERLSRPDAIDLFTVTDDAGVLAARTEAERYRVKIREATESYSSDRIGIEALEAITAAMSPKIAAAEKRALELAVPSPLTGLAGGGKVAVAKRWRALSLAARKAAARALMPDLTLVTGPADAPLNDRIIPWPR